MQPRPIASLIGSVWVHPGDGKGAAFVAVVPSLPYTRIPQLWICSSAKQIRKAAIQVRWPESRPHFRTKAQGIK